MSKAFKCDCCKKCFDPLTYGDNKFMQIDTVWIMKGYQYPDGDPKGERYTDYFKNIDLCKECTEKILNVLKIIEKGDDNGKEETPTGKSSATSMLYNILDSFFVGGSKQSGKSNGSVRDGQTSERKSGTIEKREGRSDIRQG